MFDIGRRSESQFIQIALLEISKDIVGNPVNQPQKFLHLFIFTPLILVVDPVLRNRHQILHPLVDAEQLLVGGYLLLRDDDGFSEEADQLQSREVEFAHHFEDDAEDGEGVVVAGEEHLQHAFSQLLASVKQAQYACLSVVALG